MNKVFGALLIALAAIVLGLSYESRLDPPADHLMVDASIHVYWRSFHLSSVFRIR